MTTTLQQLTAAQANKEVAINRNFETLSPMGMYGLKQSTTTGLTLGYYGGHIAGSAVADGTIALDGSSTVYVVAHRTAGVVSKATNTTNWDATSTYGRLFKCTTSGSAITAYEDWREQVGGWFDKAAGGSGGTVTSVAASVPAFLSVAGSPVTTSGTLAISYSGTALPIANGGTGGTSASAARTALGVDDAISAAIAGLSWKQRCRAATTAAVTLASDLENGDAIDGVTLATGDRILVKNQASATENGIYVVAASGAPTRATDADSGAELVNASVYVSEGTANADTQWTCTTNATITVGATNIAFAQFTSGGAVDSDDVTYAPTTLADWDASTDPGDVEQALDQLAERVTDLEAAGPGGSTQGKHELYIPAAAIRPTISNGAAFANTAETAVNAQDITYIGFDPTTAENVQFSFYLPKKVDLSSGLKARFIWRHAATTVNFGVVWSIQFIGFRDDDLVNDTTWGTAVTVADTGGTTSDNYISAETGTATIRGTLVNGGTHIWARASRVPSDGSDTLAVDADLFGIIISCTTNADTDA
jgi:hypothetical protein